MSMTVDTDKLFMPGALEQRVPIPESLERTTMDLNFGPQHPSTHGVLRIIATLEGENVLGVEPVIGYLHRNHEKIYESMQYPMITPMTDRFDYLAPLTNELCYLLTVEKALGIEVPERGQYLRVIFAELQRLLSHQLYMATFAADVGAVTGFLLFFRERELLLDLMDRATGARLLYNYFRIGGVRNDLAHDWFEDLLRYLDRFEKESWPEFMDLLLGNEIFRVRTREVGVLAPHVAIAYGASGPVLRASGVKRDLRKDEPYSLYDRFEFNVPLGERGDVYDRCLVRMYEMIESIRIIRQAATRIPDGPVLGKAPRGILKLPKGDFYQTIDGPGGEVGCHIVSDGGPHPYRFKWRSPGFVHLSMLSHLVKGHRVADIFPIVGSLFPIFGEVDR